MRPDHGTRTVGGHRTSRCRGRDWRECLRSPGHGPPGTIGRSVREVPLHSLLPGRVGSFLPFVSCLSSHSSARLWFRQTARCLWIGLSEREPESVDVANDELTHTVEGVIKSFYDLYSVLELPV